MSMDNRFDEPKLLIPMIMPNEILMSCSESKLSNSSPHKTKSRNTSNKDLVFLEQKEKDQLSVSKKEKSLEKEKKEVED